MCSSDIFLGLLAIIFPPLPVWIKCGICSADGFINILLCMLAYIPGLLHAWYIIAKVPDDYQYQRVPDPERGQHHVIIIQPDGRHQQGQKSKQQGKPQHQNGMNYGTSSTGGNASSSTAPQAGSSNHNEHEPAPPTYAEALKGDHKVQSHD